MFAGQARNECASDLTDSMIASRGAINKRHPEGECEKVQHDSMCY